MHLLNITVKQKLYERSIGKRDTLNIFLIGIQIGKKEIGPLSHIMWASLVAQ